MKTTIFIGTAHPFRGGLASFNQKLAVEFNRAGVGAKIYTFTVQYPALLFPGKSQYSDSPAPADVRIERRVNSVNPFNWIKVGRRIRRERPDAVVVRYWLPLMAPCFGTICRIARRNRHTKILVLLDNVIPHEKRPFDRLFTKYFVGRVDGFIYMSDQVKRDLDLFTTSKPALFAPHPLFDNYGDPVDKREACERLGLDPAVGYSLFFGYVREYKGLDILLEAWALMKAAGKTGGRKLLIVGEYYSDRDKYMELIARLMLTDDVVVVDSFVPDEQVRYYFCASDLVVQPYKTATQSGITQVAYHFCVPMVVTDVGGLAEIVPDGRVGYVTTPDPRAVAAAVGKFYDDNMHDTFAANMAEERKRFSWEAMEQRFEELYREVAKE